MQLALTSLPALFSREHVRAGLRMGLAASVVFLAIAAIPPERIASPFSWDFLLLTGFLTFVAGLALANSSTVRFERMLDRLERRGVIPNPGTLKTDMEDRAKRWGPRVAIGVCAAIVAAFAFVLAGATSGRGGLAVLCLFEAAWAYVAGCRIGRMVVYGSFGSHLRSKDIAIRVFPGHIDGAAGLKPFGDFCLYQASILALPAAFLAIWSMVIPAWPDVEMRTRYMRWMHPYLGLLGVVVLFEILAFVVPMWWIHREMRSQKDALLAEADRLGERIQSLRDQILDATTAADRKALNEELSVATEQYWNIERMPEWPIDVPVVRKFTFGNAALILPFVAEIAGIHEKWVEMVSGALGKISQ